MKQKIWSETYKVTSFLINLRGRAGLFAVLNFIQDVGWQHASHLKVTLPENHGWVFTRQKLIMKEWPRLNDNVTIRTWLRPASGGVFIIRDYEILLGGIKIGECASTFTMMNMKTRKMATADLESYSSMWKEDNNLQLMPEKIILQKELSLATEFPVRNSDIDSNNHVNNTKYAQWILDSLPIETLQEGANLMQYEINFLAETRTGDVVSILQSDLDKTSDSITQAQFQGIRKSDGRVVFAAQLAATNP